MSVEHSCRCDYACAPPHDVAVHHAAGGPYTGASLNPARTIGPSVVFACNVGISFCYIFAEFFGGALAAGMAIFLYGRAPVGRAAPGSGEVN